MADNKALLSLASAIYKATQTLTNSSDARQRQDASAQIMQATTDLQTLVQGPEAFLKSLSLSYHEMTALSVVNEFNIAPLVPLTHSISFEELASKSGAPQSRLERVLRLLITRKIFREAHPGQVSHTDVSELLVTNPGLAAYLGHCTHEVFPSAGQLAKAMRLPEDPSHTAFNVAFDTPDPFFTYLAKHPEQFDRFNKGMTGVSKGGSRSIEGVLSIYPWERLGEAVIADVGGGRGHISQALAKAYPQLSFVVQDYAVAINAGAAENTEERVAFEAHDMFNDQTQQYDAFYLRHILHDWPDEYCVKILKALVPGLKSGGRVLISDLVLQPSTGPHDGFVRYVDMQMMVVLNARERSARDFERLFEEADPRFKVVQVWVKESDSQADALVEAVFD